MLPLGISFYTFNSMSYTIDVYRARIPPEQSLLRYCAFVAMFPHLIAGPIVRYEQMKHQLARLRPRLTADLASRGVYFIACGCSKKLLVADSLAPERLTGLQHSCNSRRFSGHGDISRGDG